MSSSSRASPPGPAGSLLFAAGRGTRLRPLTDVVAKPALPVLDVPLASWGLAALAAHVPPVVVNVSHLAATVVSALGGRPESCSFSYEEPEALGTGGTLRALRDGVRGRLVTWNSDLVADVDLGALLEAHKASGAQATLAVARVEARADFEIRDARVVRVVDRRSQDEAGVRFLGAAVYERSALDLIEDRVPLGATEGLLRALVDRGALAVSEHTGYARDVGTLERYLRVNLDLLEGSAPGLDPGPPGEIIEVEGGRAYVGPRARAPRAALGPGAILLAGAVVESGARITRSIVWPQEVVPAGTELSNCIWFEGSALDTAG